ncbi:unnamed protein product [Cunninghamella blakesleeana]
MLFRYKGYINTLQYHYYSTTNKRSPLLTRLVYKEPIRQAQLDSKQLIDRAQKILQSKWSSWLQTSKARQIFVTLGLNTEQYTQLSDSFIRAVSKGQLISCQPSTLIANSNCNFISKKELEHSIDDQLLTAFFDYIYPHLPGYVQKLKKASRFSTFTWFPPSHRAIYIYPIKPNQFIELYHDVLKSSITMYCNQQLPLFNNKNIITTNINEYLYHPLFKENQVSTFILDNIDRCTNRDDGWRWVNALFNIPLSSNLYLFFNHHDSHHQHSLEQLLLSIFKENDIQYIIHDYNDFIKNNNIQHITHSYEYRPESVHLIDDHIQQKDCMVIRNRYDLFQVKVTIENNLGLKCAVLYKHLPLSLQLNQIKLYNESKKDVLLMTEDLDLPIKINIGRLIFKSVNKSQELHHTVNKLQQIISSFSQVNKIVCYRNIDIKYLQQALNQLLLQSSKQKAIGILPPKDVFKKFHQLFPKDQSMSCVMNAFKVMTNVNGKYFMCDWKDQMRIADCIEHIPLSFEDRWEFLHAPVNIKLPITVPTLQLFAECVAYNKNCDLKEVIAPILFSNHRHHLDGASSIKELDHIVHHYYIIEWYHWFK